MIYNIFELIEAVNNGLRFTCKFFFYPSEEVGVSESCLSQWHLSNFVIDGQEYTSAEQYMMASKARVFNDNDSLERILSTNDPREIKKIGRKVSGYTEERWGSLKSSIVQIGNLNKFSQNSDLKRYLLSTGEDILVEASPYDKIWGIGLSLNNDLISDPRAWKGQNLLGFALMKVRSALKIIEN